MGWSCCCSFHLKPFGRVSFQLLYRQQWWRKKKKRTQNKHSNQHMIGIRHTNNRVCWACANVHMYSSCRYHILYMQCNQSIYIYFPFHFIFNLRISHPNKSVFLNRACWKCKNINKIYCVYVHTFSMGVKVIVAYAT